MSNKLPPCDHDECPLSHCRQQIELTPARGSAMPYTRFIIGKSEVNGLTSFSAGDIFEKDGEIFRLCCGSGGWTLRRTIKSDGYRTDYIAPPLDGWIELPSALSIAQKLNEAANHE